MPMLSEAAGSSDLARQVAALTAQLAEARKALGSCKALLAPTNKSISKTELRRALDAYG